MQTELGHELTRAVLTTTDVFLREGQRLFRPHGITAAQYNVLSALAAAGDGDAGLQERRYFGLI